MKEKIRGLICEFNPLHLGHQIILDKMKDNAAVVCVMSGNFVQRGEAAVVDKWVRTKMALNAGADLVLELPLPLATACAQSFAVGGVQLLSALGVVNELWFGSECGSTTTLMDTAKLIDTKEFSDLVKLNTQKGVNFATAREAAVKKIMGKAYAGQLSGSNNNLGIEYLRAINATGSCLVPKTIKRLGAEHDIHSHSKIACAMQIRQQIIKGEDLSPHLPPDCLKLLEEQIEMGYCPAQLITLEKAVLAKIRSMSQEDFATLPDISEGIENRLYKAVKTAHNLEELYSLVKSKRYSHARVRRLVLHSFLGVTAKMQQLCYIRVLGMNEQGAKILKKNKATLPIIGKAADVQGLSALGQNIFNKEVLADDVFALASPAVRPCGLDFTTKLIKL